MSSDSKFPNRRAYVVKVRNDATPDAMCGRVENLLTCEQYDFTSSLELVELIRADLATDSTPDGR
ncbi:hypothetical protein LVB87_14590 [Lysobacter sp. KIS68-7]|uniref:hypothetical protein n=1 Tax=Lysobacter sp. KIS68-7 TaxID=2904252 RepID=UPI001E5DCC73|nr:hypothetical protein [Lysobacter sp. KIS68-7]UHQ19396.1 hypothetical protein LVB87_14590 [Lysobacter sp. KIS68-7]